jgi:MoaA/NifB/PqqE/SkfB family radical SAM enzyme
MSHARKKAVLERLLTTRSIKGFAQNFLLNTMAGQKLFLYSEDLPRVINISFNEKTCMFRCQMCPYVEETVRDMYKQGSEMSFETLKNLVASVPNDPYFSFDMSAIGETLQFKPLAEFIAYMKKEKPLVNTVISTNSVLLTEDLFRSLVESGLDSLQFSLFAENAEDHHMITKSRSFEIVCENIRNAARIRREMGSTKPYMQTFLMECEETKDKVEAFKSYWSQFVDAAFSRPIYNVGRTIEGMTPTFEPTAPAERYPCIMPWYATAIRSNGDVLHCYVFHWSEETEGWKVGNINEMTLAEIWNQPEFRKFRDAHRNLDLKYYLVCKSCDGWSSYTYFLQRTNADFSYSPLRLRDFFTPSPDHRGA